MESSSKSSDEARTGEVTSVFVLSSRLMWMMLGPMLLFVTTYAIVTSDSWFTPWDAAFCGVLALMIGGRWVEQQSGSPMTATGEPATVGHFRRYVRVLLPLAMGIWVAANLLGNYILA